MGSPIRNVDELGDAVRQTIRAFHGSPYDFDKFDASKIGTGEGAQAYGHGLYFAGAEDTADFYRRELTGGDDQPPQSWVRDFWEAQSAPDAVGSPESAHEWLVGFLRSNSDPGSGFTRMNRRYYRKALDYLLEQDPHAVPPPIRQGHMYEVEIGYPESSLLDWDGSLPQQPEAVHAYVGRTGIAADGSMAGRLGGQKLWWRRRTSLGPQEAARELVEAGIPGIKYYDALSRRADQGTRNYVMFPGTEDQIRILRKYGLLAPMAAAGTMGEE